MRVAVLSSGGKDSSAAWWWATCRGWDVSVIITLVVDGDSPMFQVPNTRLTQRQAAAAGVPWDHRVIDGTEGPDFEALEAMLTSYQLDGFVSGALRSDYQRNRLERLGEALGLRTWTPLWHQRPEDHLRSLAAHGFEVMVTSVSAEGLDASWLGRVLDHDALDELEALSKVHRFNVDGEGGEYESLVVRAPMFPEGLDVTWTPVWEGRRGHLEMA